MATVRDLALRVLQKLLVVDAAEAGAATDLGKAEEKLRAVHADLRVNKLVRWTLQDIPDYAEEPYVMMAAFLASPEFSRIPQPALWQAGLAMIQEAVSLGNAGTVHTEYF